MVDLIDVLFSVRKMTSNGLHYLGPKYLNSVLFYSLLNKQIESNIYYARYLVNIYFDFTLLGKYSEKVSL
jgi:hypothetical protein